MASEKSSCHHGPESVARHPSHLTDEQLQLFITELKDYQITHGSLVKLVQHEEPNTVPAVPIGVSILPTPFPRSRFHQALSLQQPYNKLYAFLSSDDAWLEKTLRPVIEEDEFVRCLWDIHRHVQDAGPIQDIHLGIFRSDYMLHGDSFMDATLKQVEMNTFSVAGGTHASIVANMHRHMLRKGRYDWLCKEKNSCQALPENGTIQGIVDSLSEAHQKYGPRKSSAARGTCVIMIVQPFNVNICDERPIEYGLWELSVPCFRVVFGDDVLKRTRLTDSRELLFYEHGLPDDESSSYSYVTSRNLPWEVSLVYMRAGYEPREYTTNTGKEARTRLELSHAIKCPPIAGHLATLKRVQQALYEPRAVNAFLSNEQAAVIAGTFMPIHALDKDCLGEQLAQKFLDEPERAEAYVLKPCLEGGGHNVFGEDIAACLRELDSSRWSKYILMEMIQAPDISGLLMSPLDLFEGSIISELGVLGSCMWRSRSDDSSPNPHILSNRGIGWSLKTKSSSVDEMSVIKGYGCFDCPLLIDEKD